MIFPKLSRASPILDSNFLGSSWSWPETRPRPLRAPAEVVPEASGRCVVHGSWEEPGLRLWASPSGARRCRSDAGALALLVPTIPVAASLAIARAPAAEGRGKPFWLALAQDRAVPAGESAFGLVSEAVSLLGSADTEWRDDERDLRVLEPRVGGVHAAARFSPGVRLLFSGLGRCRRHAVAAE